MKESDIIMREGDRKIGLTGHSEPCPYTDISAKVPGWAPTIVQIVTVLVTGIIIWVGAMKDIEANQREIQENRELITRSSEINDTKTRALEERMLRDLGEMKQDLRWLVHNFANRGLNSGPKGESK